MKYKTTKTAVMNGYVRVYRAGYAELQHLLEKADAVAYTAGVYGWNADIFDLGLLANSWNDVAICTGYRPFGRDIPAGLTFAFEKRAEALAERKISPFEYRRELRALQAEFLQAILDADDN